MMRAAGLWLAAVAASTALVAVGALSDGPSATIALLLGALPCVASAVFIEPVAAKRLAAAARRAEVLTHRTGVDVVSIRSLVDAYVVDRERLRKRGVIDAVTVGIVIDVAVTAAKCSNA